MNVNDKVSMEYEARVMIDENSYQQISAKTLNSGRICRVFTNINTYFDTQDLYLTHHHIVLRIREIISKEIHEKELTLKIKGEYGDIEITRKLKIEEECIIDEEINNELSNRGVDVSKLEKITTLTTDRIEVPYEYYLLVIDKNYYNDKIDFNLEVESTNRELAKKYLLEFIKEYNIEYKEEYISKSRRAILKL